MAKRCLIVDDSASFLKAARALLEREGIAVVGVARTGAEALEKTDELQPDVTLIDIHLGGESGFELARHLVKDRGSPSSSLILISTHAEDDFVDLIKETPVAGFLSKSDLSKEAILRLVGGDHRADL